MYFYTRLKISTMRTIFLSGILSKWNEYFCTVHDDLITGFCSLKIVNSFQRDGHISYLYDCVIQKAYLDLDIDTEMIEKGIISAKNKGCKRLELKSMFHQGWLDTLYQNALNCRYLFKRRIIGFALL